jgi:hypothetical protein
MGPTQVNSVVGNAPGQTQGRTIAGQQTSVTFVTSYNLTVGVRGRGTNPGTSSSGANLLLLHFYHAGCY